MSTDNRSNYYGDLVVTSTFSVDHPNYIGKHIRNLKIGNYILIVLALDGFIEAFYLFGWWKFICILLFLGTSTWLFFNERKIREINKDLDDEPVEVEGIVKKEREIIENRGFVQDTFLNRPYPHSFVNLEEHKELFRADVTFIRRIHVGQKVRFICTPKLKFVKAWQLIG